MNELVAWFDGLLDEFGTDIDEVTPESPAQ